ncbi:S-adenosylmethionine decarboxylase proenzyme precursor [compost metagenome]
MDDFGYHTIWDITGADARLLKDAPALHDFFLGALERSSFTVLDHLVHKFNVGGEGVTGLYLLSESHLSYHTYPESHYISIDVYTCGVNNAGINEGILDFFGDDIQISSRTILRGSNVIGSEGANETYK